jgi:DNA-binding transcriptional regulator YiaG
MGTVSELFRQPACPPRVQMLRNCQHMGRASLAAELGVDTWTLRCWEVGKESIPPGYVTQLSEMFAVSPAFLLGEV